MEQISELIGKVITDIFINTRKTEIIFECQGGAKYRMYHSQDCCEEVTIEDICGDLNDLLYYPIILATEDTNRKEIEGLKAEKNDTFTWTFYNIANKHGHVTIRWFGTSNGYYSEEVYFQKIN